MVNHRGNEAAVDRFNLIVNGATRLMRASGAPTDRYAALCLFNEWQAAMGEALTLYHLERNGTPVDDCLSMSGEDEQLLAEFVKQHPEERDMVEWHIQFRQRVREGVEWLRQRDGREPIQT